jgi:hypothetical protein
VLLGFGVSLSSVHSLADGYPPPPGPYPFATAEHVRRAAWNEQSSAEAPASSQGQFAPVPLERGYSTPVHDPFSADTLFGAAPAMPDAPAADRQEPIAHGMPYEYPAMAYPGDVGVGGPTNGTTKSADFSMNFQRDKRQADMQPGYGPMTGGSPWNYPPAPAADPHVAAPYSAQVPMDYYPSAATASPRPGSGHPDSVPYSDYKAAFGPASDADAANRGVARQAQATGSAPRSAASGTQARDPASPATWAGQPPPAPHGSTASGILFRPPGAGE